MSQGRCTNRTVRTHQKGQRCTGSFCCSIQCRGRYHLFVLFCVYLSFNSSDSTLTIDNLLGTFTVYRQRLSTSTQDVRVLSSMGLLPAPVEQARRASAASLVCTTTYVCRLLQTSLTLQICNKGLIFLPNPITRQRDVSVSARRLSGVFQRVFSSTEKGCVP